MLLLNNDYTSHNYCLQVLFLIGYGLQEEQSGYYPFLSFYEQSQKYNMLNKLEELSRSSRVSTVATICT